MSQPAVKLFFLLVISLSLVHCSKKVLTIRSQQEFDAYLEKYKNEFLTDERSPLQKDDLKYLDFYSFDASWKIECSCETPQNSEAFDMDLYSGKKRSYKVHTILHCKKGKHLFNLELYQSMAYPSNPAYAHHLFLPFKDETNGEATYGGGRYIDIQDHEIQDGKVMIDFNKAYNPWCAYSSGYNCPVPPVANHLPFAVEVGEKMYKGEHKEH